MKKMKVKRGTGRTFRLVTHGRDKEGKRAGVVALKPNQAPSGALNKRQSAVFMAVARMNEWAA